MNEKFYNLSEEKQQRIINAGFRVFANNTYRKSPVGDIAKSAGISKSLLFHYFVNKKELYLFLWDTCGEITKRSLEESTCYETDDAFEAMIRGLKIKIELMRKYPDMSAFAIKAYYEKDPEVRDEIKEKILKYSVAQSTGTRIQPNPDDFVPGLDLKMMYREMYLASEGFIWEKLQYNQIDADEMEKEYMELIEFWKSVFLRKRNDREKSESEPE